jgi:uncharacterized repeat protein (TIGR01451 family)
MKNKLIWLALLSGLGLMLIQSPLSHGVSVAAPVCSVSRVLIFVGETCVGKTVDGFFAVRNQGDQPFTITAIKSSNPAFSVASPLPLDVPAGGDAVVIVRLNCTEVGAPITTLTLDATSASGPVQCDSVRAAGQCRRPMCLKDQTRLDFGLVAVGQSVERSFQVGPDLFLSPRIVLGPSQYLGFTINAINSSHAVFSVVNPALPVIVPNDMNQVITVRMSCTEVGPQSGTLTFDADSFDADCGKVDCHIDVTGQCVGAVFKVTNTNNAGPGSLRQAIVDANRHRGLDGIQFETEGTICPESELPPVTGGVIIDGKKKVEVNGKRAGSGANGLVLERGASTVQRLTFTGFDGDGLVVEEGAEGTTIKGVCSQKNKNGMTIKADKITFEGPNPEDRNVIKNNRCVGTQLIGLRDATIKGTDYDFNGVENFSTAGVSNVSIGGPGEGDGNSFMGRESSLINSTGIWFQGNWSMDHTLGVLNSSNIVIGIGAASGGAGKLATQETDEYAGNTFAGGRFGVLVISGTGITIWGNSIHSTSDLGIDLGFDGVTRNDRGDGDRGANHLQNFPELTAAVQSNSTLIQGRFNSLRNTRYRLEFFSNTACHPSGHGGGQFFLGWTEVTTDRQGNAALNITLPVTVPAGQFITATATDPEGNTSEFSQCVPVMGTAQPDVAVEMIGPASLSDCDLPTGYAIAVHNRGAASALGVVMSDTLPACLTTIAVTTTQGRVTVRGQTVMADLGTLDPDAAAIITITARMNPACAPSFRNTVSVSAANDTNMANNTATVTTSINCGPVMGASREGPKLIDSRKAFNGVSVFSGFTAPPSDVWKGWAFPAANFPSRHGLRPQGGRSPINQRPPDHGQSETGCTSGGTAA